MVGARNAPMRLLAIVAAVMVAAGTYLATRAAPGSVATVSPVPDNGRIEAAGDYVLTGPRSSADAQVIRIEASDVALNLNGQTITCTADDPATADTTGIYVLDRGDISIENGRIVGCRLGISAPNATRLSIENIEFAHLTHIGIDVTGSGHVVINNKFVEIGGYGKEAYAIGINVGVSDCIISGNEFREIYRQPGVPQGMPGEGVAILLGDGSRGCDVRRNWLENAQAVPNTIAIWLATNAMHDINENCVTNFSSGILIGQHLPGRDSQIVDNRLLLRSPIEESVGIKVINSVVERNVVSNFALPIVRVDEKTDIGRLDDAGSNFVESD